MKKILLLATIATFLFTSCKKDFLDKLPNSTLAIENFYITQSDFDQAIAGVYAPLRELYGLGAANYGAWQMGEMRSDNTTFTYNASNRGYSERESVDMFTDLTTGGAVSLKYNQDYIIIGRANKLLAKIDAASLTDAGRNNVKGQALFLRAFAYFDLVQYFGDVPLVVTPPSTYGETMTARSSKDLVYAQIIADASLAKTLLPAPEDQAKGHVANGAAFTLLGNVYVVLKQWDKAETELKKVTGYSLLGNYASIFDPANKNNAESIFEVQYFDDGAGLYNSDFAYNFLPILANSNEIPGFPDASAPNSYGGWNTPTPDLIAAYETGDLRLDASIGFFSGESYVNRPYIKKYVHGAKINGRTDDDFPIYRYSEVLLLIAEAANEQGFSVEALSYLNLVHANTRTGLSLLVSTDQATLRTAIKHERQIELAFENKRWLDLVRTGDAVEVMTAQALKIKANPVNYYYPAGVTPPTAAFTDITVNRLLFPIPDREININPLLKQNTGY